MVWWHLMWLFKTSFVFVGVHCWSWLSLPTGCSQSWYLSYVVCMRRTLNYMSNKCPDFMAKNSFFLFLFFSLSLFFLSFFLSFFLPQGSFSPNLNTCMVHFSFFKICLDNCFCLALWYSLPVEVDACRLPADLGLECHTHTHILLTSVNLVVLSTSAGCMPCILQICTSSHVFPHTN